MRERSPTTRRTAIRTIASATAGTLALSTANSATADAPRESCDTSVDRIPERIAAALTWHPNAYLATVDRIVDGRFVVLLLEDGGELVDQHVAPRDELSAVEAGDVLVVVLSGDSLAYAHPLDVDATERMQHRFDCQAESLDGRG